MSLRVLASLLSPVFGLWLGVSPAAGAGPATPEAAPGAAPGAGPGAGPEAAEPEPAAPAEPASAPKADPKPEPEPKPEPDPDPESGVPIDSPVLDVTLPCGVRVITAKDASLPVAAVVLAIEVGTRDDPEKLPGLVHALAYHLQQGNRELAPGEGIATAHDVGGLAAMAVGPAQVRFESLVPISQLDAQLRVEALRLRAPNLGRELWLKSLSYARSDDGVKALVPLDVAAAAWTDPGLAHDGRVVGKALGDMLDQAVGAQLSRLYDYRLATLVVVGPDEPEALLARVEPLFAGLSPRPRKPLAVAETPAAVGAAPRVAKAPRQAGDSMVFAVAGTPAARAWAQVLCGTLNRQRRRQDEGPKARLRCTFSDDPRRPLLVLRAIGYDPALGPEPLIAGRLDAIAAVAADPSQDPNLAALVEAQRARIAADIEFGLRTPLDLASYLASAPSWRPAPGGAAVRPRAEVLGLPPGPPTPDTTTPTPTATPASAPLAPDSGAAPVPNTAAALLAAVPELLDTRRAVLVLSPDQDAPPPFHDQPPEGFVEPKPAPAPTPTPTPSAPLTAQPVTPAAEAK